MQDDMRAFLLAETRDRFLRYIQIDTTSDEHAGTHPSSAGQWQLAHQLETELIELGLTVVEVDQYCYVYATLPASAGVSVAPLTFCAHLDTSPSESGMHVRPLRHEAYNGGVITFPDNPQLTLSPEDAPELTDRVGHTLITASGQTLLGADDKAGIAEIMAALAAFQRFPDLPHPELRIVFTPDEEIGEGTLYIDMSRLGTYGYTLDGGEMGELEDECFNAQRAQFVFLGHNVHPGKAKNHMVNAAAIAARFIAALPEQETPEHTDHREGFYHLMDVHGNENRAEAAFILRDFDAAANLRRIDFLRQLCTVFELRYPGLRIESHFTEQYQNMQTVLAQYPEVTRKAAAAITAAGLPVLRRPIRGGTDGARLCFRGLPTPNIFAGGMLVHSKKEWISETALQKAAEVIIQLCQEWI
jgi:tripeptide aminopeptidase